MYIGECCKFQLENVLYLIYIRMKHEMSNVKRQCQTYNLKRQTSNVNVKRQH